MHYISLFIDEENGREVRVQNLNNTKTENIRSYIITYDLTITINSILFPFI